MAIHTSPVTQSGVQGVIKFLDIDGYKYEIHDQCVDALDDQINNASTGLAKKVSDLTAQSSGAQSALAGLQTTVNGNQTKIDTILASTDTAVAGSYVTNIKITDGKIATDKTPLTAAGVSVTDGPQGVTTVQAWLSSIQSALTADPNIIEKVKQIIKELEESEGDSTWNTIVDKLRGLTVGNQSATVKEYVDNAVTVGTQGMVKTINSLTPNTSGAVTISANDMLIGGSGEDSDKNLVTYLEEQELVVAAAFNDLNQRKLDANTVAETAGKMYTMAVSGETLTITSVAKNFITKVDA